MSIPNETVAEFKKQQEELDQNAKKQAEQGYELSRDLEVLRTTQHHLINDYTIEALDKWKVLLNYMEAAEARALEREDCSKSYTVLSTLIDKSTPRRYQDYLPIPDVLEALQRILNKAKSLRSQAETLERSAAELFADSTQLRERVEKLEGNMQDYVRFAEAKVVRLGTSETRSTTHLELNERDLFVIRNVVGEASSKASRWDVAHNITKVIPGTNLITYPVTKYFTKYYAEQRTASEQLLSDLEVEREDWNTYLQYTRVQIDELRGAIEGLRAIGESGCATATQVEKTKTGARALGQLCATTATSALVTIRAIDSVGIRLDGKDAIIYMQERGNILDALRQHIQHIDSSEEGAYSSLARSATRGLEQSLLSLQTSKFMEFHKRKQLAIGAGMGDL